MFSPIQLVSFLVLFVGTSFIHAVPINDIGAQELIVFNPPVTSPKASVAWAKGSHQTVKWDTAGIPTQRTNNTGLLLLGYFSDNDGENLDIDSPLASGFSINAGSVKVTMPTNIPSRNDYFVVLFGDSGNRSPKFKIH